MILRKGLDTRHTSTHQVTLQQPREVEGNAFNRHLFLQFRFSRSLLSTAVIAASLFVS